MLNEEYSSDSNDEDYQPTEKEAVSEEEESGEDEAPLDDTDTFDKKKRRKLKSRNNSKLNEKSKLVENELSKISKEKAEENKKKKEDDLWNQFMKDVTPNIKNKSTENSEKETKSNESSRANNKVKIVEEYKFAGETIRVENEVDANSKKGKIELHKQELASKPLPVLPGTSTSTSQSSTDKCPVKRPTSGISNLLDKITKKPKLSVLNKSLMDWKEYKDIEGIDEDLKRHNKGKNGYIEKMAFLQRTDLNQFEIEKDLRNKSRRK